MVQYYMFVTNVAYLVEISKFDLFELFEISATVNCISQQCPM